MMLPEETIIQIYFHSDRPRSDALIADEVDIIQFAENLLAVAKPLIAKEEHQRCVKIVSDLNKEVGKKLHSLRP